MKSCAKISVQIGNFFKASEEKVSKRTTQFAQVNSRVEFHSFKAIEKLYREQILQPMQVLWVMDAENRRAIKERKKLIKNQVAKFSSWQKKVKEKESIESDLKKERLDGKERRRMFGAKRKSITVVNKEVLDKLRAFEEAEVKQKEITKLTENKLDSMANARFTGELLSSAVAGVLACQLELNSATRDNISEVKGNFKEAEVFKRTLRKYTAAAQKGQSLDEKTNLQKGFVFGRMLTTSTPDIVCDCIAFIKCGITTEGLFRIPGNRTNVEAIQASYDKNEKMIMNTREDFDIHDVCSALKFYFNTLPEPIIPYTIYEKLEKHFDDETRQGGLSDDHRILDIMEDIPQPYKGLLGFLLNFLHDVFRNHKTNHMTSTNIATCFAPVLLKPRPDPKANSTLESLKSMKNIAANIKTVSVMIENARIFKIPPQKEILLHTNVTDDTKRRVKRAYMHTVKAKAVPVPPPNVPSRKNRQPIDITLADLNKYQNAQKQEENVLQSDRNKQRGFIRKVSVEGLGEALARPLPNVGGLPPGLGARPPQVSSEPPVATIADPALEIPNDEIPAALLGTPGTIIKPVKSLTKVSIDNEL